jgi:hypothetical protein
MHSDYNCTAAAYRSDSLSLGMLDVAVAGGHPLALAL